MPATLADLLDRMAQLHATVVGDVMLDEYIVGRVSRVSPEAPVLVVQRTETRWVPGGAANVAKNAAALGASATVIGVTGADEGADRLQEALAVQAGLRSSLVPDPSRVTTRKTRVVADHSHQVLRIDDESTAPIGSEVATNIAAAVERDLAGSDVLLISDYRKGLLTPESAAALVSLGRERGIPVVVNAKPGSAAWFAGATLLSLNRSELSATVGEPISDVATAMRQAESARSRLGVEALLATLGEQGQVVASADAVVHYEAPRVEAYDVAGAGDTVIATVALGVAALGLAPTVFQLAIATGAKVVRHVGVAVPTAEDLAEIRTGPAGSSGSNSA
jgi:rfaE bifunctional protein kinase chain/domain